MAGDHSTPVATDAPPVSGEIDAEVRAWRAGATHLVLITLALVGLPIAVFAILGEPFERIRQANPILDTWIMHTISLSSAARLC